MTVPPGSPPPPPPGHQQPGHQGPPAGYQPPPPGYEQPPSGYQPPPPGYEQPPSGYQPPPPGYEQPPSGYQAPPGYEPPSGHPAPPAHPPAAMVVPAFFVKQRITVMVNRYEVLAANPDGSEGQLLALAEQKRMKLKEEVIFYSDESKSRRVFSFKARQRLDVGAQHDVYDEYGTALGMFSKQFGASLLRSTWNLSVPGLEAVGQERRLGIAILRRVWDFLPVVGDVWVPFVFHFDFVDTATGAVVLVSDRQKAIRDRYTVTVPDPRIDFRVAASMAVALDALQSR